MTDACDLLVRGRVVTPGAVLDDGYVAVAGERITAVGRAAGGVPDARRVIEAGRAYVLPGVIDTHVHTRSEPAEGITNCTRSAIAGGVTTIVDMPYDTPAAVPDLETFRRKVADVEAEALCDIALYGTIRKEGGLDEIPRLAASGACAFKLSTYESHPLRFPRIPDGEMLEAFSRIAATGRLVAVHCENQDIIDRLIARLRAEGDTSPRAHCRSRPPVSETEAIGRVLELAHESGARVHVVHASVPRSLALVARARAEGVRATVETCVQYLIFDETVMDRLGALAKINPPLRGRDDIEGMWAGVRARRVDWITSDHAPWSLAGKRDPDIFKNGSGAPGVETLLPLLHHYGVVRGRISMPDLARLLAEEPARQFGLFPRKGVLAPGADADLAVLDPDASWTVRAASLHQAAGWTPYEGLELGGRVARTFLRGRPAYEEGRILTRPGDGRFLRPEPVSLAAPPLPGAG